MPEYDVIIKAVPAQRVLAMREVIASADDIATLFEEVGSALKAKKVTSTGAWIALYHHEGFRDTDLDIEIAVPVADSIKESVSLEGDRQLEIQQTTGYEQVATVIENAHHENWSGSYTALGQFIEANQYEIAGPVREVYLTEADDDDGWLVEIQFPLKAK